MKKNMIVVMAMSLGMLTMGALTASAADTCGKCVDQQAVQKFTQETDKLASALKAKDIELREQYGFDGFDTQKVGKLETEIKELKDKINASAQKHGIPACSRG